MSGVWSGGSVTVLPDVKSRYRKQLTYARRTGPRRACEASGRAKRIEGCWADARKLRHFPVSPSFGDNIRTSRVLCDRGSR